MYFISKSNYKKVNVCESRDFCPFHSQQKFPHLAAGQRIIHSSIVMKEDGRSNGLNVGGKRSFSSNVLQTQSSLFVAYSVPLKTRHNTLRGTKDDLVLSTLASALCATSQHQKCDAYLTFCRGNYNKKGEITFQASQCYKGRAAFCKTEKVSWEKSSEIDQCFFYVFSLNKSLISKVKGRCFLEMSKF